MKEVPTEWGRLSLGEQTFAGVSLTYGRKDVVMNRRVLLAGAIALSVPTITLAQPAANLVPGAGRAAAGADAAAVPPGGTAVTVTNKCCSIFDFLGVGQVGRFVDQNVLKTRLGQAVIRTTSPVGRAVGLGPSLVSDKFAKEPGALGLAAKLKMEEKKIPLKLQAIKYLATQDCLCNPEVVEALLQTLDDCAEQVRWEALKALHKKCNDCGGGSEGCADGKCNLLHGHKHKKDQTAAGCQCQRKVVQRLNALLLARDETGCLKEKSERIRALAQQMIEECLSCLQPPPVEEEVPAPDVKKPSALPDPTPRAVPDALPKAKPDTSAGLNGNEKPSRLRDWWREANSKREAMTEQAAPVPATASAATVSLPTLAAPAPIAIAKPAAGPKPIPSVAKPVAAVAKPVPAVVQPAVEMGRTLPPIEEAPMVRPEVVVRPPVAAPSPQKVTSQPVQQHISGYRGTTVVSPAMDQVVQPAAITEVKSQPIVVEPVIVSTTAPEDSFQVIESPPARNIAPTPQYAPAQPRKRHLVGELFGY